jgi:hypothetical protein
MRVRYRKLQEDLMLFRSAKIAARSLVLTAITLLTSAANGDMITLGASRDATIYQNSPGNSNGAGFTMFAGDNGMNSPRRALLDFDIAGSVPAGSTINSVQLTLVLQGVAGVDTTPRTISLNPLLANWGEGTTGAGLGGGGTGQGFPANPGDATWSQNSFGTSSWTNAGGDFSATSSASAVVSESLNTAYTWGSTAGLISDVQHWLDSPASNFGWILMGDETGSQTFRQFYTREEADADFRPALLVDFTPASVPEPSTLTMLGLAALCMACYSRRIKTRATTAAV